MIIFSATNNKEKLALLEQLTKDSQVVDTLKKHDKRYQIATSVYKNRVETWFITSNKTIGRELARTYKQECYLERGHRKHWYLVDTESDKVTGYCKTIRRVNEKYIKENNITDYMILNNCYYYYGDIIYIK